MRHKIKKSLLTVLSIVLLLGVIPSGVYAQSIEEMLQEKVKPVLDYAYVQDGKLRVVVSDNYFLNQRPIYFNVDKELRHYYINNNDYKYDYEGETRRDRYYEIDIEIPSKISIIVRDWVGNESAYNLTIKEDNVAITKNVPIYLLERLAELRQSVVNKFKEIDNIFELEYGKYINVFSLYDEIIRDNYRSYDKNEIRFKVGGLSIDKEYNIKLNKYGIFKVTISHSKDKTFEEIAYILIKPDWKNTNNRKPPINRSPYIVYNDKIKLVDYFTYDDEIESGSRKSKVDTTYMLVYNEDTNSLLSMNDGISLELNKSYLLKVLNFEDDSMQSFYVMRQEKPKLVNETFTDLNVDHWASRDINLLVSKGLLSGYPDGKFKPSGNITVKEFMSILSRHIASASEMGKPIVRDRTTEVALGTWGYIETKSILDRLTNSKLSKFKSSNFDRLITRQEVAFLIDSTLELGIPYSPDLNSKPTDISDSAYPSEIEKLVGLGFISGYPDGSFKPLNNITRAEVAALFARIK